MVSKNSSHLGKGFYGIFSAKTEVWFLTKIIKKSLYFVISRNIAISDWSR